MGPSFVHYKTKSVAVKVEKFLFFCFSLPFGVFHDIFWRLKSKHPEKVVFSCPDVMFNVYSRDIPDERYAPLATKWNVKKWVESSGRVRWYGCRRGISYAISRSCSFDTGFAVPPCDLENLADAIKFVMKECEEAGLFCELQEGTLLGNKIASLVVQSIKQFYFILLSLVFTPNLCSQQ